MALSNAERQAAYRARKRKAVAVEQPDPQLARPCARCLQLEEEVRHLKAELAKRNTAPLRLTAARLGATVIGLSENPITAAWSHSRPVPKER